MGKFSNLWNKIRSNLNLLSMNLFTIITAVLLVSSNVRAVNCKLLSNEVEIQSASQLYEISDISISKRSCSYDRKKYVEIRKFTRDEVPFSLIVESETLKTFIIETSCLSCHGQSHTRASKYEELLQESNLQPGEMREDIGDAFHNDGIVNGLSGIALTIDMCPSSKQGYDDIAYDFFYLHEKRVNPDTPLPIGIAITGRWIETHEDDLQDILNKIESDNVTPVWINHSYSHPYGKNLPLDQNFLISKKVEFTFEVVKVETSLLERGIIPSAFFRYPGLVSDSELSEELYKLGLIPLGSDAWIAKKQYPVDGSIILIHGNKNEPAGITRLERFLTEQTTPLKFVSIFELLGLE